jgi:hypothetical protein
MNGKATTDRGSAAAPPALWASAFVILAMIVTQAGRIGAGASSAIAGNVSTVNDLTVLTAAGGDQQDNLVILDRRAERVFIYGVARQGGVQLYESYDLKQLFIDARSAMGAAGAVRP